MEKTEAPTLGQQSCAVGPGEQEFPRGSRFQPMLQAAVSPGGHPLSWAATAKC